MSSGDFYNPRSIDLIVLRNVSVMASKLFEINKEGITKLIRLFTSLLLSEFLGHLKTSFQVLSQDEKISLLFQFEFYLTFLNPSFLSTKQEELNKIRAFFNETSDREINGRKVGKYILIVLKSYKLRYHRMFFSARYERE